MDAGRELDALVAEKVMGWKWSVDLSVLYPPDLHPANNIFGHQVPCYSTDIAAAWQVVEKLRQEYKFQLADGMFGAGWGAAFYQGSYVEFTHAETAPLAICKAALKAVDAEVAA